MHRYAYVVGCQVCDLSDVNFVRNPVPPIKRNQGFSLVEVTMALGITAFAGMTMIALLPSGMTSFQTAMNISVSSQIAHQVVVDMQAADFDSLNASGGLVSLPVRLFDAQGNELSSDSTTAIYQVAVGVNPTASPNLDTIVVDIINNPGNKTVARDTNTGGFVGDPKNGIKPRRFSIQLARNEP
jgi:uncharacterized protein (TIGR02598 family)